MPHSSEINPENHMPDRQGFPSSSSEDRGSQGSFPATVSRGGELSVGLPAPKASPGTASGARAAAGVPERTAFSEPCDPRSQPEPRISHSALRKSSSSSWRSPYVSHTHSLPGSLLVSRSLCPSLPQFLRLTPSLSLFISLFTSPSL